MVFIGKQCYRIQYNPEENKHQQRGQARDLRRDCPLWLVTFLVLSFLARRGLQGSKEVQWLVVAIEGGVSAGILLAAAWDATQVVKEAQVRVSECEQVWLQKT